MILALALAPPAAIGVGQAYSDYLDQRRSIEIDLRNNAQLVTLQHQIMLASAQKLLSSLAAQDEVRLSAGAACDQVLRKALENLKDHDIIVAVDRRGQVRCSSGPVNRSAEVSDREWFQAIMHGQEYVVSGLLNSRLSNSRTMVAAVPLRGEDGGVAGAVALNFDLLRLIELSAQAHWPSGAFLTIMDQNGQFLPLSSTPLPPLHGPAILGTASDEPIVRRMQDETGQEIVFAVAPLTPNTLYAVFGQPAETLFGWLRVKLAAGLAAPILLWAAAVITAWAAANHLVLRWITQLRNLTSSFVSGRPTDRRINFDEAPEELAELGGSFLHMMRTIEARNHELREAIQHRDVLIKEIHHRVKNNLQIISSLLNLQSRAIRDGLARDVVLGMRSRINALALVHRSLYETDELQQVPLKSFIEMLSAQLQDLMATPHRHISVLTDVVAITVEPETAVTIAMLITEAVTNAFKHAFGNRTSGTITVRLERDDSGRATLTVADDGMGGFQRAANDDIQDGPPGLGRELMIGYVKQLGGELTVSEQVGTEVKITFPALL